MPTAATTTEQIKMAPRTRSKARVEAASSLFEGLNDDLQNMIVWATTEGGMPSRPRLTRRTRSCARWWRILARGAREWLDAWMERDTMEGESTMRSISRFEAGDFPSSRRSRASRMTIQCSVDNGWPRKQAEAYTLMACLVTPLAAVRDRSDVDPAVRALNRYAASTRIVCEALAQRAKRMTKPRRSSTAT